jgi:hypothetical protein
MKLKNLFESEYGNDANLTSNKLTSLPANLPARITGKFRCNYNQLTSLEHCPVEVGGDFWCYHNRLTSLEHCPAEVGGDFWCNSNQLTSLEHCPTEVVGGFLCDDNKLTSLEHCPADVGGDFWCNDNELTSLKDINKHVKTIGGSFRCNRNQIESHILGLMLIQITKEIRTGLGNGTDVDAILNKWKNQGRVGVLGAMRELAAAGYEELAQL